MAVNLHVLILKIKHYSKCWIFADPVTHVYFDSQWQKTPLHRASYRGHTTTVQLLLEAKADANARDDVSIVWVLYVWSREDSYLVLFVMSSEERDILVNRLGYGAWVWLLRKGETIAPLASWLCP